MSVLIKDMKMPKCCLECPFEDSPEFDSYCIAIGYEFIGKWGGLGVYKPDWCPLEEPKTGLGLLKVKDGHYVRTPSTEAAHGEWIKKYNGNGWNDFWDYTCSNCGKKYERADAVLYNANYCPNCGADMRGEKK